MDDESMEDYRDRITRYYNRDFEEAFSGVKQDFLKASPEQRIAWIQGWDRALSQEMRPSKDHAEWLTKRRELGHLHELLKSAGR